jgi:hypothetical protein
MREFLKGRSTFDRISIKMDLLKEEQDNEALPTSWRKFAPDFTRKLDQKVQVDPHPIP